MGEERPKARDVRGNENEGSMELTFPIQCISILPGRDVETGNKRIRHPSLLSSNFMTIPIALT